MQHKMEESAEIQENSKKGDRNEQVLAIVNETNAESPNERNSELPSTSKQNENPVVKRKTSKKKRTRVVNDTANDQPQSSSLVESEYGYPLQLEGAEVLPPDQNEVQQDRPQGNAAIPQQVNVGADGLVSQPTDKVYIQETSGFRKAEREQYEKYVNERQKLDAELNKEITYVSTNIEAIQTGITCQNVFRTFALILQGLVAGFSAAHCLLVVFLSPPYFSNVDFVNHYTPLAMPLHCAYYVVLVICTVAVIDRYDINQTFLRVVWRALTFQSGGLAILLYLTVVAINAVCLPVEERMTLYLHNATSISNPTEDRNVQSSEFGSDFAYELNYWRALLITRAVLTCLAWLLVAMRPNTDLLTKHMRKAGDEFNEIITKPTGTADVAPQVAVIVPNPS